MRAFRVAYDGRPYRGFQRQPDVATVEDAILDALVALGVVDANGDGPPEAGIRRTPPGYAAAGRTDAGVSAVAQTVAFEAPDWLTPAALNAELPADVRAWASADVPEDFHATRDAVAREYVYHLYGPGEDADDEWASAVGNERSSGVDDERAREALARIEGTHDFHNLTAASDDDTVRTVERATAERDGDYLVVSIRADGFLRKQVRRVVSVVDSVARGEGESGAVGMERVERVLGDESLSGAEGVAPASPYPLVLVAVEYPPSVTFEVDQEAAASAREVFEALRVQRATGARVAGSVVDGVGGGS